MDLVHLLETGMDTVSSPPESRYVPSESQDPNDEALEAICALRRPYCLVPAPRLPYQRGIDAQKARIAGSERPPHSGLRPLFATGAIRAAISHQSVSCPFAISTKSLITTRRFPKERKMSYLHLNTSV